MNGKTVTSLYTIKKMSVAEIKLISSNEENITEH